MRGRCVGNRGVVVCSGGIAEACVCVCVVNEYPCV